MKKLTLVLLLIVLLVGCKKKDKEIEPITFMLDDVVYTYVDKLDNGYDLYRNSEMEVEIKSDNDIVDLYYVPEEDIFHVVIDIDNIVIKKNGSIIISCARDTEICSGFENPSFKDDLYIIADQFN